MIQASTPSLPVSKPETAQLPVRKFTVFNEQKLAPALVVITMSAIIASFAAEKLSASVEVILLINGISYIAGGWFGLKEGIKSLIKREINVDLLMILAALGAASVNQWREGAILLFLFSLSNVLQTYAMERSRNAIRALLKLRPNEATVKRGSDLTVVPVESLALADIVVIRPGERFPIDGRVVEGESTVDQSSITGESMPITKSKGDDVFAGTVNQNGGLSVTVTRLANDTTLSRIIKMVEDAQGHKAITQRFMEEFEQKYAVVVIVATLLFIAIPPLLPNGPTFSANFYRAMVLLTVASPCALVISTPASILSAIANAARRGILFKGGAHLEQMATIKAIAFDKTGTITRGRPVVTDIVPYGETTQTDLLGAAAALESRSEHPIARAVVAKAQTASLSLIEPDSIEAIPGAGIRGRLNGKRMLIGTDKLMVSEGLIVPDDLVAERTRLEDEGKTVLLAYDGRWLGAIAVADEIRADAPQVIRALREAGVEHIVILTGDNERVARAVARQVGADEVQANLLPEHKVEAVKKLTQKYGTTAMVGDGVNDAPALASATLGIAMGAAGTDVALETADVVLMSDDLNNIAYAINLSRRARRIVRQNLTFSLGVIVVLVLSALGLNLPLPFGVVGHEGSTLIVVANGLRLLTR